MIPTRDSDSQYHVSRQHSGAWPVSSQQVAAASTARTGQHWLVAVVWGRHLPGDACMHSVHVSLARQGPPVSQGLGCDSATLSGRGQPSCPSHRALRRTGQASSEVKLPLPQRHTTMAKATNKVAAVSPPPIPRHRALHCKAGIGQFLASAGRHDVHYESQVWHKMVLCQDSSGSPQDASVKAAPPVPHA
jgi:hypothetical protein